MNALQIEDIILGVFANLPDPRLLAPTSPLWWVQHDPSVVQHLRWILSLSLVCRAWIDPARRVAYQKTVIHFTRNHGLQLLSTLSNSPHQATYIKTLIIILPFSKTRSIHEDAHAVAAMQSLIALCPCLAALHLDNLPHTLVVRTDFISLINSLGHATSQITALGLRCMAVRRGKRNHPAVHIQLPPIPQLQALALSGVEPYLPIDFGGYTDLANLSLHHSNPSITTLHVLFTASLDTLHIDSAELNIFALRSLLGSLPTLRTFTYRSIYDVELDVPVEDFEPLGDVVIHQSNLFPFQCVNYFTFKRI